jgi:arabinogalactan endo-1,4-beta-galactosidase
MRSMPRMPGSPHRWRVGLGACALLLVAPFAAVAITSPAHGASSTIQISNTSNTSQASTAQATSQLESAASHAQPPTVNWALLGSASATSVLPGFPASNAIDGDAGTDWCTWGWTGTLTLDLGQARALDDLGLTLDSTSPSASAQIELATTAGDWQQVPGLKDVALDPGSPMYLPLPRSTTARYAEITVYSDTGANVCTGEVRAYGPDPAASGMQLGTDLSFTPQELAAGATFSNEGQPGTPVQIMRGVGSNYVRIRLWVDPPPGYSDLASDLALARQVHAAGMQLYLDVMYSDFWADPQHQDIPAAWQGQDLAQLTSTVQSYTRSVIQAFAHQGTPVDMVSIGNEIRNGILWPTGEINCTSCGGWANFTQLLKAGVTGAEAGNPAGHKLLIMMHYDQGADFTDSSAFYSQLESYNVPFDVIGLSYYPVLSEPSISQFKANVDGLANEFGKPIVLAETQYPWTLANGNNPIGDSTGDFAWETSQIEPGYPATPGGQLSFVTDELSILATAPHGLGMGLFYWAPDWIPGVPWEPGAGIGSPNVNMTLFNFGGQALPSINIFRNPAQACERQNPGSIPCVTGG